MLIHVTTHPSLELEVLTSLTKMLFFPFINMQIWDMIKFFIF